MTEQIMTRITQEVELILGEDGHWYVMIMVKVTHYREPVSGEGLHWTSDTTMEEGWSW